MGVFARVTERVDRQAKLMGTMMECLTVDLERAGQVGLGYQMESAIRSCIFCNDSDACERWLREHADENSISGPRFCPNRAFFALHRK